MELKGKIIDFLGDSITEGVGVTDIENCRYDNVIRREYGLKATYNYGIGGTRLAHQSVPSEKPRHDLCFCGRVYNINPDADIVVVYGGVNDYFHGDATVGTLEDTTPKTFCGGVNFLMNYLDENFKDKTIVFMTPARSCYQGFTDEKVSPRTDVKKADAMPVIGYVDIIKEAGKNHNIPVLDLYHNLPMNPNIPEHAELYTVDGLHFNDVGHSIIAKTLAEFLLSL